MVHILPSNNPTSRIPSQGKNSNREKSNEDDILHKISKCSTTEEFKLQSVQNMEYYRGMRIIVTCSNMRNAYPRRYKLVDKNRNSE